MVSPLRGWWWHRRSTLCRFTTVDIPSNYITNRSSIHSRPNGWWKHRRARRYSQVNAFSDEFCLLTVVSIVAERWTKINTIISLLRIICSLRKFSVIVSATKWRTTIEVPNGSAVSNPPAILSMNKLVCSCRHLLPSKCPRSDDTFRCVKMRSMAMVVRLLVRTQNFIRDMIYLASISRMSPCRWLDTTRWRLMIWMVMRLSCWICKPTRSTRGDQYRYATLGSGSFPSFFRVFHASERRSSSLIVIHMPFVSSPGKENLPPVLTTPRHSIDSSIEQALPGNG